MDLLVFSIAVLAIFLVGAYAFIHINQAWAEARFKNLQNYISDVAARHAVELDKQATDLKILKEYLGIETDFENAEPGKVLISYVGRKAA